MSQSPNSRSRILCGLLVAALIALGLASRMLPAVPEFIRTHAGDALWAAMVYWGIALLFPKASTSSLTLSALAFSFAIELSQLSDYPLLVKARATRLGALVLGHGFLWIDILRYITGIAVAAILDLSISQVSKKSAQLTPHI